MAMFIPEDAQTVTLDSDLFPCAVRHIKLGSLGIGVYLMEVTPKLAELWMATKSRNRTIRLQQLNRIKRSLGNARWEINGEPLIFDAHGRLLDGQHRLQAVVDTGVALWSLVVTGIDQERFHTMGQGSKRSVGDILGIAGEKNASHLGAALRWVWRHEHGQMLHHSPLVNDDEIADSIKNHEAIVQSIPYGNQKGMTIAPGLATALHYLFHQRDAELANSFFRQLADGADLPQGHPVLILRNTFIGRAKKRQLFRDERKAPMVILAWNLLRKDAKILLASKQGMNRINWQGRAGQKYPEIL